MQNLFWKAVELKKGENLVYLKKPDTFSKKCKENIGTHGVILLSQSDDSL